MSTLFNYRSLRRYKYQLMAPFSSSIPELAEGTRPGKAVMASVTSNDGWIRLQNFDLIIIKQGYCWDGPSGPTIDTKNFMRGSLVHDALYQLMREEKLARSYQKGADDALRRMCIEDGMWRIRAWWVWKGVRDFGYKSTYPRKD
jgi:hypothetical protein